VTIRPALVGLETVEKYGKMLDGAEFNDCKIDVMWNGKLQFSDRGNMKFTSYGVEGELMLTHSRRLYKCSKMAEANPIKLKSISI